jgi:outer membrane protein assembly factor BamB
MTITASNTRKPLRLMPAVILAIALVLLRYVAPLIGPDAELFSMPLQILALLGGMACSAAIILWWLFFSRAPWMERIGAIVLIVLAVFALLGVVHESISGGFMGRMLFLYSAPVFAVALVAWAVATRHFSAGARLVGLLAAIVLAAVPFTLIRTGGVLGSGSDLHWRWTPTPEQRLLARGEEELKPLAAPPADASPAPAPAAPKAPEESAAPPKDVREKPSATPKVAAEPIAKLAAPAIADRRAEWPGFRGPERDSVIRNVRINTDWSQSPPVEMWRRPIGPGWSSFAVRGDLLYTQEQRGEEEIVACYRVSTGEPVWKHRDPVRFWESNGGAGPRGTPTISGNRIFAFGATGILNALDAADGKVIWSRNAATDTKVELPGWGFASSPLVLNDLVIVAVAGQLAAYDAASGNQRWVGPAGGAGYSSPHYAVIDGVPQVLLLRGSRTTSVSPTDGKLLWENVWQPGVSILQPAFADGGDVLVAGGDGMGGQGIRRLAVAHAADKWNVEERWATRGLKPYFNDFVVHKGHAFGFDGSILACIDLTNGERKWKGGRYGNGQLVLLPAQDLLLVLSEEGELALVSATSDQYKEISRFKVLDAKTWNHPVLVHDVLLVRNGEEMAAFRVPVAGRESTAANIAATR